MLLVALVGSALGYNALRRILYEQLDRSLYRLAEIEAAGTADSRDSSVHFHEELFGAESRREVLPTRYAEVWSVDGEPVLRTANLGGQDLPLPADILGRIAESNVPEFVRFEWQGQSYRGLVYPLGLLGAQHKVHLMQIAAPTEPVDTVLSRFLRMLVLTVFSGTLLAWILGWWLAGYAVRPVMQIIGQAESLDMTGAEHRLTAAADTDEMRRLVTVLNSMLGRIDAAFDNQRRFLADAGHEIKTPLTILRGDVEVALRRDRSPEEYQAVLGQTLEDLKGVSSLAEDLITLARSDSGGLEPRPTELPVQRLLTRVADRYAGVARQAGIDLVVQGGDGLVVLGDSGLLERALNNLVDNAIKYGRGGAQVTVSADAADGCVRIAVADEGPGISGEERPRLFERFYRGETGRRAARGSGLGLAIVSAIVDVHGGSIEFDSELGRGTTVCLVLPEARERPADGGLEEPAT